jgi:hypothetical protein
MGKICSSNGAADVKCIHNFGDKVPLEEDASQTEKELGG